MKTSHNNSPLSDQDSDFSESEWEGDLEAELLEAAQYGDADSCEELIEHDANINHFDEFEMTALHYAAECGYVSCVKILLSYPEIDATFYCMESPGKNIAGAPLHLAAAAGHGNVVKVLLTHPQVLGAINDSDENGYTALHEAIIEGHHDVAMTLVEAGADINCTTGEDSSYIGVPQGLTAIGLLIERAIDSTMSSVTRELLSQLLQHEDFNPYIEYEVDAPLWKINPRELDIDDQPNILHLAVEANAVACIPALLVKLPEPVINQVLGDKPPIYPAVKQALAGDTAMLKLFLECEKYNPKVLCDGKHPLLHVLVKHAMWGLLEILARHPRGKNFDLRDYHGRHVYDLSMSNKQQRVFLNHVVKLKERGLLVKFDPHAELPPHTSLAEKRLQYSQLIDDDDVSAMQVHGLLEHTPESALWGVRNNPEIARLIPEFSTMFHPQHINDPSAPPRTISSFVDSVIEACEGEPPTRDERGRIETLDEQAIVQLAPLPEFDRPRQGVAGGLINPLDPISDNPRLLEKCKHQQELRKKGLINTTTGGSSSLPSSQGRETEFYEPLLTLSKAGKNIKYSKNVRKKVKQLNKDFAETGKIDSEKYNEFIIANYRGVNFNRKRVPKDRRYQKLMEMKSEDYFCDLIWEKFPELASTDKINIAKKIIAFTQKALLTKVDTPIKQTWNDKKQRFDYPIHFILQRFSNNKDNNKDPDAEKLPAFSDDIWSELIKQNPELKALADEYGIPLVKNFIIAFAKHPRHPIRYVLGKSALKLYRDERTDGRARNDGSGNKYRLLGGLLLLFSTLEEYVKSCPLDINQAYAQGYIASHPRVRNEIEVDFPGYIPKERIDDVFPIFLPSFKQGTWKPIYADIFGLSKTVYNRITEQFMESKRSDEDHKKTKNAVRDKLIAHYEQFFSNVAIAKANLRGKTLLYVDSNGTFSLAPQDAKKHHTHLRKSAKKLHTKNVDSPCRDAFPKGILLPEEHLISAVCASDDDTEIVIAEFSDNEVATSVGEKRKREPNQDVSAAKRQRTATGTVNPVTAGLFLCNPNHGESDDEAVFERTVTQPEIPSVGQRRRL